MGTGSSPAVKWPGRGVDHPPPPHLAPRLREENSYTSTPPLGLRGLFYGELYLLTPWSKVLEKLTGSAASQEIPLIFGTRRFINVLTSARHLSLP